MGCENFTNEKREGNDGRICVKFCISLNFSFSHNLCLFHRLSVSLCFYLLKRRIEAKKYFLSFVMLILFKSTFSWKKLLCDKLIRKVQGFWKEGSVGENAESERKQVFRVRFAEKKERMNEWTRMKVKKGKKERVRARSCKTWKGSCSVSSGSQSRRETCYPHY